MVGSGVSDVSSFAGSDAPSYSEATSGGDDDSGGGGSSYSGGGGGDDDDDDDYGDYADNGPGSGVSNVTSFAGEGAPSYEDAISGDINPDYTAPITGPSGDERDDDDPILYESQVAENAARYGAASVSQETLDTLSNEDAQAVLPGTLDDFDGGADDPRRSNYDTGDPPPGGNEPTAGDVPENTGLLPRTPIGASLFSAQLEDQQEEVANRIEELADERESLEEQKESLEEQKSEVESKIEELESQQEELETEEQEALDNLEQQREEIEQQQADLESQQEEIEQQREEALEEVEQQREEAMSQVESQREAALREVQQTEDLAQEQRAEQARRQQQRQQQSGGTFGAVAEAATTPVGATVGGVAAIGAAHYLGIIDLGEIAATIAGVLSL